MTEHLVLAPGLSDHDFLEAAVLACERHPTDAMERAVGAYAEGRGVSSTTLEARWLLVRDYDFDALRKHMSHVWHALDAGRGIRGGGKGRRRRDSGTQSV